MRPQNLKKLEIVFQVVVAFSENLNFNFTPLWPPSPTLGSLAVRTIKRYLFPLENIL